MECCKNMKEKKDCCCDNNSKNESVKGGKGMVEINTKTMLWVVIGILVLATIFLTLKASSIGAETAQATVTTAKAVASTASSGMVGGC